MKYAPFFIVLIYLSGCGGGSIEKSDSSNESNDKLLKKTASIGDAELNARAVRALFFRQNGASSRRLKKKSRETKTTNCLNTGTVTTIFTEAESNIENTAMSSYQQNYANCKAEDNFIYNGDTYGVMGVGVNEAATGTGFIFATYYDQFSIKYNTKSSNRSFGTMPFSPNSTNVGYNINVDFSTKVDTVHFSGGYFNTITIKENDTKTKTVTTLKSMIDPDVVPYYRILGEDNSGAEWSKIDVSYKLEEMKNNTTDFKFSINTEKTIFAKECTNQYETKTVSPIHFYPDETVSGEMLFYNKSDNITTRFLIIDADKVELSADFDDDGQADYKEVLSWTELFGDPNEEKTLSDYKICR